MEDSRQSYPSMPKSMSWDSPYFPDDELDIPAGHYRTSLQLDTNGLNGIRGHQTSISSTLSSGAQDTSGLLSPVWHPRSLNQNPNAGPWNPIDGGVTQSFQDIFQPAISTHNSFLPHSIADSHYAKSFPDSGYGSLPPQVQTGSSTATSLAGDVPEAQIFSGAPIEGPPTKRVRTTAHNTSTTASRPRASSRSTTRTTEDLPACVYCLAQGRHRFPKNSADHKKHELTHKRPHACTFPDCRKRPSFATLNDLERHQRAIHFLEPKHGTHHYYKCIINKCQKKDKLWDRKDNFKQHIQRIHKDITADKVNEVVNRCKARPTPDEIAKLYNIKRNGSKKGQEDVVSQQDQSCGDADMAEDEYTQSGQVDHIQGMDLHVNHFNNGFDNSWMAGYPYHDLHMGDSSVSPVIQPFGNMGLGMPAQPHDFPLGGTFGLGIGLPSFQTPETDSSMQAKFDMGQFDQDPVIDNKHSKVLSTSTEEQSNGGHYQCDECPKVKPRQCDLKKHKKRHTKPFGCTYPKCRKQFGSKNDWKRHENSQHVAQDLWRCDLGNCAHARPARIFYHEEFFAEHLQGEHGTTAGTGGTGDGEMDELVRRCHVAGRGGGSFWCGFCKAVVRKERSAEQRMAGSALSLGMGMGFGMSVGMKDEMQGGSEKRLAHVGEHFDHDFDTRDWICVEMNEEKRGLFSPEDK